jgi:hypothetical protein
LRRVHNLAAVPAQGARNGLRPVFSAVIFSLKHSASLSPRRRFGAGQV